MPDPTSQEPTTIVLPGGFSVPMPPWARTGFGVIAVVAIAFGVYRYYFPTVPELVSVKQANAQLQLEVRHYNQHIVDEPVAAMENAIDPSASDVVRALRVRVRIFEDGCLLISRRSGATSNTRLLVDSVNVPASTWVPDLMPTVSAAQSGCSGHPPNVRFTTNYGRKIDGCWVEVHRNFEDSCSHIQLFNACTNTWATEPNGAPRVQWTRCVH